MAANVLSSLEAVRRAAGNLDRSEHQYDPLIQAIGESDFALLGEASHGTDEFYRERAEITKRLISEKGFNAVAVEADWPDAYRVNRYIQGRGADSNADEALSGFKRFPTWMWRNTVVVDFVEWLREHNLSGSAQPVGFYGMDLYSLYTSIEAVLDYLEKVDPEAAKRARYRYSCFEHFNENSQAYGYAATIGATPTCEQEVINQLIELRRRAAEYANRDGWVAQDEFFFAEQNARVILNAERYYRSMFGGRVESWNLRDQHMVETLESLAKYIEGQGRKPRIAVWAHNSHLGDARATEMGERGEWNVGQLVRERHGNAAFLLGFSTYSGTVTAASDWDGPAERKRVRPGLPNSFELLFHEVGIPRFSINLRTAADPIRQALIGQRLERAIGVIYRPETERMSHYFGARLADQFDALLHFDETSALQPLERTGEWNAGEPAETFPFGV